MLQEKERNSGNNTTHQVLAAPTSGTCTKEEHENSVPSCTVYMKSVKSSGNSSITPPLNKLTVTTEDHEVPVEVDTGSSVTLLSFADFTKIGGQVTTLRPSTVLLKSYTEDIIQCLGEKEMDVKIGDQMGTLLIRVAQGPSLLGRDMMSKFTLPWQNIFSVAAAGYSSTVL